jgi:hypothetical protein
MFLYYILVNLFEVNLLDWNMKLILVGVIALLIGFIAGGFFTENSLTGEATGILKNNNLIQSNSCGTAVNYSDFSQGLNACISKGFSEAECKACMYENLFKKLNSEFEQKQGYTPPGSILEKCRNSSGYWDWLTCLWKHLTD